MSETKATAPTGKLLADLARSCKCHPDVFKDGAGKAALEAIVKAAQPEPAKDAPAEPATPAAMTSPQTCWRCGSGKDWERHSEANLSTIVRCTRCGAKYITPKF